MTMDNGEGRPLDEVEAGNDDPQGWYFDLPGGAWERQEEKNRTLRQRVLGNLTEDEAKAKSDPFGRKPAEPEEKKGGRGFFGRRKKEDDPNQRTSAGGTWVLNRGNQPTDEDGQADAPGALEDDDADDWSTEPSLKLTPFPRAATPHEQSWGDPDGGWELSRSAPPEELEPALDVAESAFDHAEPEHPVTIAEEGWQEQDAGTKDFLASMRSWAQENDQDEDPAEVPQFRVPTYEEAAASEDTEPFAEPEQASLTLRPRPREADEKQLDWNFGPAAWSDSPTDEAEEEPVAFAPVMDHEQEEEPSGMSFESMRRWAETNREAAHPHFTVHPESHADDVEPAAPGLLHTVAEQATPTDEESAADSMTSEAAAADEDPIESMRRWAERNRDADHPHFTVHAEAHDEADDEAQGSPIPLRPRSQPDATPTSSFAPAPPSQGGDDLPRAPLQLPIIRRAKDQEEEPVHSEKWNDFFAIQPAPESSDEAEEQPSEGLAAMRAWAQKRHEPETPENIPEEFLKPFDWELEEGAAETPGDFEEPPAELLKPFAWESEDTAPEAVFEPVSVAEESFTPPAAFELPALEASAVTTADLDDPLDGIFPPAAEPSREEKKKRGRFGRLFGRGKGKEATSPQEAADDVTEGEWLLPSEGEADSDIRVASVLDDWSEDAGTLQAPEALEVTGEGWGASLAEGWAKSDNDAIHEFSDAVAATDAEWLTEPVPASDQAEPEAVFAWNPAVTEAEALSAPAAADEDQDGWNPEPVAMDWQPERVVPEEGPAAYGAAESLAWEPELPVSNASIEAIQEPAVAETPRWEQPAVETEPESEAPVEAVASVEAVAEELAVAETPWWEQPAVEAEPEAPVEAVASVEPAVEEAAVAETPWWQQPAVEAEPESEAPVEAVASVEPVVDEPAVAETPWWEQPAAEAEPEQEAPVEAVASVEPVVEEAAVAETPWWEQPAAETEPEQEAPIEAVASVEPVAEEPVAEEPAVAETPWWQQPAVEAESEAPVEAVASVEPAVEEPAVAETPWWERPAVEAEPEQEAPIEAVASVEPVVEEPPVVETPWWEQPAVDAESEAPVEAVASVEPAEEEAAVADTVEVAAASTAAEDDDPWADFVKAPAGSSATQPPPPLNPRWGHEPVRPPSDEDMWGHVAAQAEEHASADHQLDLAASLESQMAGEHAAPAYSWHEPEEDEWISAPQTTGTAGKADQDEDDVILAAFERHAATPEAPSQSRDNDEVFAELLGTGAADIVAEADDQDDGRESFIKMSAWAPQRRADFDGGWAPEQEVEEALSNTRPAFGGSDGAGFAPPSWALDEFEGGPEAAPAAGSHHRTKTWIRELVETGLLALLVFLSVRASFQNFKVEGSSMYPTLHNGQFLIVNKLVYSEVDMEKLSNFVPFVDAGSDPKRNVFHGPERGDIIVLKDPRNTETDLIKRVIGLPGETIEIADGKVYINDHLLDEPYIKAVWHDTKPKVLIPPGEYFVMGDNRDNSLDSRSSQVGLVPQDLIIGKAMLSYWPREQFGLAPNEEGKLGEEKPALTTKAIGE